MRKSFDSLITVFLRRAPSKQKGKFTGRCTSTYHKNLTHQLCNVFWLTSLCSMVSPCVCL